MKKKYEEEDDDKKSGQREVATLTNSYLMVDPNKLNGVLPRLYNFTDYNNFSKPTEDIDVSTGGITPSTIALPDPIIGKHIQLPDGDTTVTALSWQAFGEQDSGWIRAAADDYKYLVNGSSVTEWLASEFRVNYLTLGSVLFAGTSGKVDQDNARLFWDNTNKIFRITVPGPSSGLQVCSNSMQMELYDASLTTATAFFATNTSLLVTSDDATQFEYRSNETTGLDRYFGVYNGKAAGAFSANAQLYAHVLGATGGDPMVQLGIDSVRAFAIGVDNSDSDKFKISYSASSTASLGTNDRLAIDTSGNIGIGTTTPRKHVDILDTAQAQLRLTYTDNSVYADIQCDSSGNLFFTPTSGVFGASTSVAGGQLDFFIFNSSNTAGSDALHEIIVGGSSAGDPVVAWTVSGGATFTAGIDNSDSDNFKIGSGVIATSTYLTLSTAGVWTVANSERIGSPAVFGNRLSVKGDSSNTEIVVVDAPSGQTTDLETWRVNGTVVADVTATGSIECASITFGIGSGGVITENSGGSYQLTTSAYGNDNMVFNLNAGTGSHLFQYGGDTDYTFTTSSATFENDLDITRAQSGGTVKFTINNTSNTASSNAELPIIVGGTSANDPFVRFSVQGSTSWSIGLDNSDTDAFKVSNNTALGTLDYLKITTGGDWTGTVSGAGGTHVLTWSNSDNTNAASHSAVTVSTGGSSSGDPIMKWSVTGIDTWSAGMDNSDSWKWKLSQGGALGTNDAITVLRTSWSVILNNAAVATSATDGFLYIASCAGTPTGTPTAFTGRVAMVYDTTNNVFYVYNGGWKGVALA